MSAQEGTDKAVGAVGSTTEKAMDVGKTDLANVDTDPDLSKTSEDGKENAKKGLTAGANALGIGKQEEDTTVDASALPDPEYITNFCKNRNTPQSAGVSDIVKGLESVLNISETLQNSLGTAFLGIFLVLYLIWTFMKYYDLLLPFAGGAFNILKFLIIYTIVIVLIVFFFKFTSLFGFWYVHFVKFFKLMLNPLLDDNVSFLFCYFTDYVNWIIYFPAMFVYALCVIGLVLLLFLVVLPILAVVSFLIGFLFSLIGEPGKKSSLADPGDSGIPAVGDAPTTVISKIGQTASAVMSKIPGVGRFMK